MWAKWKSSRFCRGETGALKSKTTKKLNKNWIEQKKLWAWDEFHNTAAAGSARKQGTELDLSWIRLKLLHRPLDVQRLCNSRTLCDVHISDTLNNMWTWNEITAFTVELYVYLHEWESLDIQKLGSASRYDGYVTVLRLCLQQDVYQMQTEQKRRTQARSSVRLPLDAASSASL